MYFLFIFESLGTAELILIGIVALIFLGPRKLPSIAKTIGKTMADLRNTTNEFKSTWEREVNFEEEAKALRIDDPADTPLERTFPSVDNSNGLTAPEIREVDPAAFDHTPVDGADDAGVARRDDGVYVKEPTPAVEDMHSDKKNWL